MDTFLRMKLHYKFKVQFKIQGNDDVCCNEQQRISCAAYSACSTETYDEKLCLRKAYGIVLGQIHHELLRNNSRTRFYDERVSHQFKCLLQQVFIELGQMYCVSPALAVCLLSRNKSKFLHQIVLREFGDG